MNELEKEAEFVNFLAQLLSIPSHSGSEQIIADFIEREFRKILPDHKIVVQEYDENGGRNVIILAPNSKLLIDVHLDTVAPGNESLWTSGPYTLALQNDSFVALGSVDVKINIALCYQLAMNGFAQNVSFAFIGGEEVMGQGIRYFVASEEAKEIQNVLVCEPTNSQFHNSHRGCLGINLLFRSKKKGHGSIADYQSSANWQTLDFMNRLRTAFVSGDAQKVLGDITFDFDEVHTGTEGVCKLLVIFRTPKEGLEPSKAFDFLKTLLEEGEIENYLNFPPCNNLQPFTKCDQEVLPYWSHAGVYCEVGKNVIVGGPGSIEQAHTYNEFVSFKQANMFYQVLIHLIKGLL